MSPSFQRIAVLGLGLLGGSVALAARRRRVGSVVAGATRSLEVREIARRLGAVDEVGEYEEAVDGADLVVLATPVFAMGDVARRIAPCLRPGAVVTDVGSVKALLVETLPGILPPGVSYVGSHPMAGSHERGIGHAQADLFEGATCVVTDAADAKALERICAFWRDLGARVVRRDPSAHDAEVAWTSHVPHALAFAFARSLERAPSGARELSGAGLRDFTRIAHSDPRLWADILTGNHKALAGPLQAAAELLAELSRAIEANDADAVERLLAAAGAALAGFGRAGRDSQDQTEAGEGGARESRPGPASHAPPGASSGRSRG